MLLLLCRPPVASTWPVGSCWSSAMYSIKDGLFEELSTS